MYEKLSVIALVLLATARSEETSSGREVRNANSLSSRFSTILPYSSRDDPTSDDRGKPLLFPVSRAEQRTPVGRTRRCAAPRKPGAPPSPAKRDTARAGNETVASPRRKEAFLRALKRSAQPHETGEGCNAEKCVCYCSEEDGFRGSARTSGSRKPGRPGHRKPEEDEKTRRTRPSAPRRKCPKSRERPRASILTGLINRVAAPFYHERPIPAIHHHMSVPYAPPPELMGNPRPNGASYHVVRPYGRNVLLGDGRYPPLIHHSLYPWPLAPERGRVGSASPSPLDERTDDEAGSYEQGDYFEWHYPETYDQFEDYPESREVVASGRSEDLAELTTVASTSSSPTETSALEKGREEGSPNDNRDLPGNTGEARVSIKKLASQSADRTMETARSSSLGKSKSKTDELLLSPYDEVPTNASRDEETTGSVVAEEQIHRGRQEGIVAAGRTLDGSSTSGLPLCDNTLLLSAIGRAIDEFASDSRLALAPGENTGLEVLRGSNLRDVLSVTRIEDAIVERVKDLLAAVTSVSREDLTNDWSHGVIRNTLRSVVDTFHGIHRKLSPTTTTVEEHRYKDGQWTVDEVTLGSTSDSEVAAVNPAVLSDRITSKISDPAIRDRLSGVFQAMKDAARQTASRESAGSDAKETPPRGLENNLRQTKHKDAISGGGDAREYAKIRNKNYQKAKKLENDAATLLSYVYSASESPRNLDTEDTRIEEQTTSKDTETEKNILDRVLDETGKANAQDEEKTPGELESSMIDQQADSQNTHGVLTISADPTGAENGARNEEVAATIENSTQETSLDPENTTEASALTTSLDNPHLVGDARHGSDESATDHHIDPLIILERITNKEPPIKYYPPDSPEDGTIHNGNDNPADGTNDAYSVQLLSSSPTSDDISELRESQLYYVNEGERFPLEIQQLNDGSYVLSFPRDICEHFLQKECPCCVPRNGHVIQSASHGTRAARKKARRKNTRDSATTRNISTKPEEEQGSSAHRFSKRTLNNETATMSVADFAKKYNLLLDLDRERAPDQPLKSINEYDKPEGKNPDTNRETRRSVEGNRGNVRTAGVNVPEEKTEHAASSGDRENFIPKRTILSKDETKMSKLLDTEEGNAMDFRKKKKREDEESNGRPFRYQRNASGENKSAELVKSVLYWFKGLILDE